MAMTRIYVRDKKFFLILILWLLYQNADANQKTIEKLKEYQKNALKNNTEYFEQSDDALSEYDTKTFNVSAIDEDKDKIEIEVPFCGCKNNISINEVTDDGDLGIAFNKTTCSRNAFLRGKGQKIVGFSYYPPANHKLAHFSRVKNYIGGIKGNLNMMPIYYHGWIMRLYFDFRQLNLFRHKEIKNELCEIACTYPNFDICDASNLPGTPVEDASKIFAKNWRFFPTLDPQVDIFVSRDLDSRFNERENAAVVEWIESEQYFHTMRDRPQQTYWPIIASTWGTKLSDATFRYNWTVAWKQAMKDDMMHVTQDHYDEDQKFLMRYIWPWARNYSINHDSYLCEEFPNTRPFPIKRQRRKENNYAGAIYTEKHIVTEKCPLACRPKNHPDWELC